MKDIVVNQQEMPNQAELGWLAGIIDGDGCISMNVRRKNWKGWNGIGVDMNVYVVNTDGGIIEKTVGILRKLGIEPHLFENKTVPLYKKDGGSYHNPEKTIISVNVTRMADIIRILTSIQPYLGGEKKHRASLIAQFIERRISRQTNRSKGGATWYDGYDWEIVDKFYAITGGKLLPEVRQLLNDQTQSRQDAV